MSARVFLAILIALFQVLVSSYAEEKGEKPEEVVQSEKGLKLVTTDKFYKRNDYSMPFPPTVLDLVWALVEIQTNKAKQKYFRQLFNLNSTNYTNSLAKKIANKIIKVNYFKETGGCVSTVDISKLDPDSDSPDEWGWGGLSEFSGKIADIVGELNNEDENA